MSIEQLYYAKIMCDQCGRAMREKECGGEDCYGLAHNLNTCKYEELRWVVRPFSVYCPTCLDKQLKKLQTNVRAKVKRVFEHTSYRITTRVKRKGITCTIMCRADAGVRLMISQLGAVEEVQIGDRYAQTTAIIDVTSTDIDHVVSRLPEIVEELEQFGVGDAAAMARDIFRPLEGLRR